MYYDANGDGIRDASDWGIRDAIVALSSASTDVVVTTTTDMQGAYSFTNLAADNYTINLLTPSVAPGQPSVGTLTDLNGTVSAGPGVVSSQTSIADIQLADGSTANDYDFGQLAYPASLISKRLLLNTDPGIQHTTAAPNPPVVPEPGTLALLVVAGLSGGGFLVRRRRS